MTNVRKYREAEALCTMSCTFKNIPAHFQHSSAFVCAEDMNSSCLSVDLEGQQPSTESSCQIKLYLEWQHD